MDAEVRPRLRGVFHQYAFFAALAAGAVLVALADGMQERFAAWVYAAALAAMFGASALYHRFPWRSAARRLWARRVDHAMIFIFIAGTYTPFAVLALPEPTGLVVLIVVWVGAVGGAALKLLRPHASRWIGVPFYLALGWVAVFVLPDLLHRGGVAALVLLLVGGGFYTLGALCYAFRRPVGWPTTFGYHEFFHAATVVAAICHHVAIWLVLYA
jgi:hemolysin III